MCDEIAALFRRDRASDVILHFAKFLLQRLKRPAVVAQLKGLLSQSKESLSPVCKGSSRSCHAAQMNQLKDIGDVLET